MSERAIVSNKSYRELLETRNVFADPAYCREAWKSVGTAILLSPAIGCIGDIDTKDGAIESYTYRKLTEELKSLGRKPTELEMIFHCQAARARFDTSAAVFVRDTVGAKPVDESKVTVGRSQYEEMSDDELEALLRYRQSKTYEGESTPTDPTDPTAGTAEEDDATIAEPNEGSTATIAEGDPASPIGDDPTATIASTADTEGDPASTIVDEEGGTIADPAPTADGEHT